MNIKLADREREWVITHLEELRDFIESANQPDFDWHASFGPLNLEFVEHLAAVFKEQKCGCGTDFSK